MSCTFCGDTETHPHCPRCSAATAGPQPLPPPELPRPASPSGEPPTFRFARPEVPGLSISNRALGKRCPRCGLGHQLEAAHCGRCGRAFQTVLRPRTLPAVNVAARRTRRAWGMAIVATLAVFVIWLAAFLWTTRGQSDFQFACVCYGQDQAHHGRAGGRAADWADYARSHFMAGSVAFPGGERVLLYDQSRNNILVAYIVMRRTESGWQRLPDDAGLNVPPTQ